MSRHGTELLLRQRRAAQARQEGAEQPEPSDRPDWRFCVRCNVLEPAKIAGDECGFCGGALMPTSGPKTR